VSDRESRTSTGGAAHRRRRVAATGPASRRYGSERARFGSAGHGQSVVTVGQFFAILRRHWFALLACVLLGVLASAAMLASTAKTYQSTAVVDITPTLPTNSGSSNSNNGVNTITEAKIATSSSVAADAAQRIGFAGTPDDLVQHVNVTSPLSSQVLNITFSSSSAQGAARGANAFANAYLDYRRATAQADLQLRISRISDQVATLQGSLKTLKSQGAIGSVQSQVQQLQTQLNSYRTTVITPGQVAGQAAVPTGPSAPKPYLYLAAGLLVGLLVGIVFAVTRDRRDDRVRAKADLEASLGAPVLAEAASVEASGAGWPASLAAVADPRGAEADAYRTVAATVSSDDPESRVVMLCCTGREGSSLAPMNLAATFALQGLRTVLAGPHDAVRPAAELLGVAFSARAGRLADSLAESTVVDGLTVLDLGDEVRLGATLRGSGDELDALLEQADMVVLDGVNIELPSTSLRLGQLADDAVVLVYRNRTTHLGLERLAQHLAQVGTTISGAVLLGYRSWLPGRRFRPARRSRSAQPNRPTDPKVAVAPSRTGRVPAGRPPEQPEAAARLGGERRPAASAAKGK